ncbi:MULTISPECIES: GNAT family N-acetyltransferase [unclassified Janthinobacterium]|uniref:GNAT family N-acetyltransferase n=1 Tax=unclassified Janthinobacterium TaxID=2610881 RepID=UPI001E652CD1|nr:MULTISPECIES: GNAT family N-acetyltransferase [unclassified Janthinobacterium]MCC7642164.1 GNAT family N-acetyltransferase [Janthinobacterium sp. EB271-G4-3-1]MCC7690290.1 GNAT family N-acetyltransferase [Janthinobacterium sp. EB271-G4-3-2]
MPASLCHFSPTDIVERLPELGALLQDCVYDGASIGFILPFDTAASQAFWTDNVLPAVTRGVRLLLVAEVDGRVAGAVQLDWDTNPNQAHRAEVRKLLVAPTFRRHGIARQLMQALEAQARQLPRSLLTLDTRSGDQAQPLYLSLGYVVAGSIPAYALAPDGNRLDATTIMYKQLRQ